LREKESSSSVNLFDALMNAARIDKDTILMPETPDTAGAITASALQEDDDDRFS
jgi:hypothetical protein